MDDVNPDILINCAAEINLDLCESNLNYALKINSLVVKNMAFWCKKRRNLFKYQQINFLKKENKETDFIYFYNNYGLSKYLGECFAKEAPKSLILRTDNWSNKRK